MKIINQSVNGIFVFRGECSCCRTEFEETAKKLSGRPDAIPLAPGFEVDCDVCGNRVRMDRMEVLPLEVP